MDAELPFKMPTTELAAHLVEDGHRSEFYHIKLVINDLPKTPNALNARHWRIRHQNSIKWESLVRRELRGKIPPQPLKRASLIFTRHSAMEPDFDGLCGSFKSVMDSLVKCEVLQNDTPSIVGSPTYLWKRAKPKQGFIEIEITERTENEETKNQAPT